MRLRARSMEAFQHQAAAEFEDDMARHLAKFAAWDYRMLGEIAVRRAIRHGCERALGYGLSNRGPVRLYLELMFMFGGSFDTDRQLHWAGRVLDNRIIAHQTTRAARLHSDAMAYIQEVLGPERDHSLAAMRRFRAHVENLRGADVLDEDATVDRLAFLYPTKFEYVGEFRIREMIRQSVGAARRRSLGTPVGEALFITLAFAFGHGFEADPLYPWIEAILDDHAVLDPSARVERLRAWAADYLREATT